jgi:Na+-transporting methylmalonyl-CoA/oxaloacetate decarboxylase beta subunit
MLRCWANLFREAGCLDRLSDTSAKRRLMNTVTIMLATGTGLTMKADSFLNYQTILIIFLASLHRSRHGCRLPSSAKS